MSDKNIPAFERWYYEIEFEGLTIEEIARMAWWAGREYEQNFQDDLKILSERVKENHVKLATGTT